MNKILYFLLILSLLFLLPSMGKKSMKDTIEKSFDFSAKQYASLADVMRDKPDLLPRTIDKNGTLLTDSSRSWISGFFPGTLWYLYEATKDPKFLNEAKLFNARGEHLQTHPFRIIKLF